jgi:hypothetical protein
MRLILLGGAGAGPVDQIRDRIYAALPNAISAGTG